MSLLSILFMPDLKALCCIDWPGEANQRRKYGAYHISSSYVADCTLYMFRPFVELDFSFLALTR